VTIHAQPAPPEGGKSRRVYLLLRDEISNGVYPPGVLLPGENRLADTFAVSRVTIRKALEALAADGWIEKRPGAGSVVLDRSASRTLSADLASLMPQIVEMDRATTARLLSFSYGAAPAPVARALKLGPDAKVQTAVRIRSVERQPFSHLTTHVPEDIARTYNETDLATQPLFRLLERTGVKVDGAQQSVTAALATPDVAEALAVSVGSPLLSLKRTVWDASGRGVEFLSALYRPDLFRLEMTLTRVGAGKARHWEPVIGEARE
jgi:GntR family transcriptional regulator